MRRVADMRAIMKEFVRKIQIPEVFGEAFFSIFLFLVGFVPLEYLIQVQELKKVTRIE
eukprot:m.133087 g.133087  ORF g.133087 m.133087 type:complete len:58 (-) comp14663_c0_seq1:53-226(-)